ncbi:MAG: hypothetical protein C1943_08460 [Halochromatium sp.]|nr:hypothetical protein [Halochromatium sp.]
MHQRPLTAPFAALMPTALSQMPVAWQQLRIPAPPPALKLSPAEQSAKSSEARFARRSIQQLLISQAASAEPTDQLALIDKASPHALFDLMLAEVSPSGAGQPPKPDPSSVLPITAQVLWQTAANFQRFVSDPELCGDTNERGPESAAASQPGWLQLALNCDPNTNDRESVQALKSFHLHLIYWRPEELRALARIDRFGDQHDPALTRQCLDPLSFIGPRLLNHRLADLEPELERLGATLLPTDATATCAGWRPMGCLIQLPRWDLLATSDFERLIRRLHQRLDETAGMLLRAITGYEQPPPAWQRHRRLPLPQIERNLQPLGLSAECRADLLRLIGRLRDLPAPLARFLSQRSPAQRMHCMTLNQPCYSLCLSPMDAQGQSTMGRDGPLLLSLQLKLFSGIGGAGLISLPGLPSVRVLRGQGSFSAIDWQRRANFQRRFAAYNTAALMAQRDARTRWPDPPSISAQPHVNPPLRCGPIAEFQHDFGWTPAR